MAERGRDRLLADILGFLVARRVTAEAFGVAVCGDRWLVQRLRAGRQVAPDFEIRLRVVMNDWDLYGGAIDEDRVQAFRRRTGEPSMAAAIRRLGCEGLRPAEIARLLGLSPAHVSGVLGRPELAPRQQLQASSAARPTICSPPTRRT